MEAGVGGFACSWWMQGLCKGCTEGWGPRGHCAGPAWPWMYDSTVREMILKLRPKNVAATDTQMGRLQPPRRPRICYLYVPVLQHTHTHTCSHMYAHTHPCTLIHMHTDTHALICTQAPSHTHSCTPALHTHFFCHPVLPPCCLPTIFTQLCGVRTPVQSQRCRSGGGVASIYWVVLT